MGKVIFIVGGARSGKSRYALKLAKELGEERRVAFIATCEGLDGEMRQRIALHRKARPGNWKTFEEPRRVSALLKKMGGRFDLVVIDCLTLFVSNLRLGGKRAAYIEKEMGNILRRLKHIKATSIIVSNEVGLGIVPENPLARDFRDIAGRANQITADAADSVYFMISGIPWRIK